MSHTQPHVILGIADVEDSRYNSCSCSEAREVGQVAEKGQSLGLNHWGEASEIYV